MDLQVVFISLTNKGCINHFFAFVDIVATNADRIIRHRLEILIGDLFWRWGYPRPLFEARVVFFTWGVPDQLNERHVFIQCVHFH